MVWLDDLLTERGHDTRLHIIIEMNAGLEAVFDIARSSPRIDALFFGGVDMAADLRCKNAWEPLLYARSRVVHAAASIGVEGFCLLVATSRRSIHLLRQVLANTVTSIR